MASIIYILSPLFLGLLLIISSFGFYFYIRYKKSKVEKKIRQKYLVTKCGGLEGPGWSEVPKPSTFSCRKQKKLKFTGFYGDDVDPNYGIQEPEEILNERKLHYPQNSSVPQYNSELLAYPKNENDNVPFVSNQYMGENSYREDDIDEDNDESFRGDYDARLTNNQINQNAYVNSKLMNAYGEDDNSYSGDKYSFNQHSAYESRMPNQYPNDRYDVERQFSNNYY